MTRLRSCVLAVNFVLAVSGAAMAQHAGHGTHNRPAAATPTQTQASNPASDADRLMSLMREMHAIMERIQAASPQERARLTERMGPMMSDMMPMMQGMMGQGGSAHRHQGHGQTTAAAPSTQGFLSANERMHRDMDIAFTGNADVDFVRGMIPHHQGAIDMAKVVLQHGRDETTRKWANDIIREQEREIAEMREWLRRNGG